MGGAQKKPPRRLKHLWCIADTEKKLATEKGRGSGVFDGASCGPEEGLYQGVRK